MASNEVWGVDIGKSSIKAVKMRRVKNQLEIVAIDIIEYEQDFSESEGVDREEQIRQALSEFQARNKIKSDRIFVSIPGQATFNRLITIPPVEQKRIKEIVTYEAQQQIPFPIDEVLWDYQLIGPQDKTVEEREVMLFAVRKEIINNFLANLNAANLDVDGVQIAPLAIYNFMRYEYPDMDAGVAIDIGAENTDLVVIDHDKLWLRALPSAGDDITKALQKRFNIPYQEAEKLKLKSGKTKQAQKIFEVMKPVLRDLVGEIHRSVGYYKSMAKEIKFGQMVFMGNATKLSGFEKFFSQNLQYSIGVLSQVKRIRVSQKINVAQFQTNISTFVVAMGLAIQGLGKAVNDIRLLPDEIKLRKQLEIQKPYLMAAVLLLAVVPFYKYWTAKSFLTETNTITPTITKLNDDLKKQEGTLNEVKNFGDLEKRLFAYANFGKNRSAWPILVNKINEIYLRNAKVGNRKIWLMGMNFSEDSKTTEEVTQPDPYIPLKYRVVRRSDYLIGRLKIAFEAFKEGDKSSGLESFGYIKKLFVTGLLPTQFRLEDFKEKDIEKLVERFREDNPADPFTAYLKETFFSKELKKALGSKKRQNEDDSSQKLAELIISRLNEIATGDCFYQASFGGFPVAQSWREETKELIEEFSKQGQPGQEAFTDDKQKRLNILLLEDAYPEIPRPLFEEVKIESFEAKSRLFGEEEEGLDVGEKNFFHATILVKMLVDNREVSREEIRGK